MNRNRKSSEKRQLKLKELDCLKETSKREIDSHNGGTDVTVSTSGTRIIITPGKAQALRK